MDALAFSRDGNIFRSVRMISSLSLAFKFFFYPFCNSCGIQTMYPVQLVAASVFDKGIGPSQIEDPCIFIDQQCIDLFAGSAGQDVVFQRHHKIMRLRRFLQSFLVQRLYESLVDDSCFDALFF